jgi:hypothetical protein
VHSPELDRKRISIERLPRAQGADTHLPCDKIALWNEYR